MTNQIPDVEEDVSAEDAGEGLGDPLPQVDLDVGKVRQVTLLPVPLRLLVQLVPDLDGLGLVVENHHQMQYSTD